MNPLSTPPVRLRLAHLTTVHRRDDTRIFQRMARSLAAHGHEVILLVADGRGPACLQGVRVVDVGRPAHRLARALVTTARMGLRALRMQADVVHVHDPELLPVALLLKLLGMRVIYDIHEYYRLHLRTSAGLPSSLTWCLAGIYGVAERLADRCLDACVVVVPEMQRQLTHGRSIVVRNTVCLEEFRPRRPAMEAEAAVCYVGVLAESRCIATMARGAALSGVRLMLAGGWYPQDLAERSRRQTCWHAVEELGWVDRQQMQTIFDRSLAGICLLELQPGETHCSITKIYEYMAAGLPLIVSDLPPTRSLVKRHRCGLLIPRPNDAEALARAIRWLRHHPAEARRMGERGRQLVESEDNWERELAPLLKLVEDLTIPRRR